VVERYISELKEYEKTDTVPIVEIDEEKEKAHKTGYTSLYDKLFGDNIKNKKNRKAFIYL